jgi:hypothetical protein
MCFVLLGMELRAWNRSTVWKQITILSSYSNIGITARNLHWRYVVVFLLFEIHICTAKPQFLEVYIPNIHKRMVQLNTNYDDYILKLDGAPPLPPFSQECTSASQSCSSTALDRACCKRRHLPSPLATRSPDLIPYDFFLSGFVKDSVYVPPCPSRNFVIG